MAEMRRSEEENWMGERKGMMTGTWACHCQKKVNVSHDMFKIVQQLHSKQHR